MHACLERNERFNSEKQKNMIKNTSWHTQMSTVSLHGQHKSYPISTK